MNSFKLADTHTHLWAGTADLADVTVVELRLFGWTLGLLHLVLEDGFLIGVACESGRGDDVVPCTAPGGIGELFWGLWLRVLLWGSLLVLLLLLSRLVIGGGGCVATGVVAGIARSCQKDLCRQKC